MTTPGPDEALASYYAQRAGEYDQVYAKPERREELEWLRTRLRDVLRGRHVLEVACGTGYWTAVIAEVVASVDAFDFNAEPLAVARGRGLDPARIRFARGDAYAPVAPRGCDAAMAGFWWSHVPRRRLPGFLQTFHQAVGPGGTVVFFDNVYAPGSSTPISRCDAHGDTWQLRLLADGSRHEVLKNFPDADELRAAIAGSAAEPAIVFGRYYWLMTYRVR